MFSKKEIGFRILKLRRSLNLSQQKFADKLDINRSTLSHIESGDTGFSIEVLYKIVEHYPISYDMVMNGIEPLGQLKKENEELKARLNDLEKLNVTQEELIGYLKKEK